MILGRDRERGAVAELLAQARQDRSGVLVLRGEAGVGKSTLLRDAVEQATGMTVLRCAGVESEIRLGFSGLHQLLAGVVDQLEGLPAAQAAALRGALGLSDDRATDLQVCVGVLSLLAAVAERRPLLVVVDDLQWLDRSSAAVLVFVCRRLLAEPIAVLIATREPDSDLLAGGDLPELRLAGLTAGAADALLDALGCPGSPPLRTAMIELTAGNPLALTELVTNCDADEIVNRVALAGMVPLGARLHDAFVREINRLPADARDLLLVAAVEETGRRETVLGAAARLGVPARSLEAIERATLVHGDGQWVRFRHPLIRSAVYQDAPASRRTAAHRAIGEQLMAAGQIDRATWHLALATAEPDERLAEALESGAEATERRGGSAAAAAGYRLAARLSTSPQARARRLVTAAFAGWRAGLPEQARALIEAARAEPAESATEAEIAHLYGLIELTTGDPMTAYDQLTRAGDLFGVDNPEVAAPILFVAADAAYHANRMADAIAAGRRMATLDSPACRQLGDWLAAAASGALPVSGTEPELIANVVDGVVGPHHSLREIWPCVIGWLGPNLRQARAFGVRAAERLRAAGNPAGLSTLMSWLVDLDYQLGRWPDGLAHIEEGLRFADATSQPIRVADLLAQRARLAAAQGDRDGCRAAAIRALDIALRHHNRAAAAVATWALGLLSLTTGEARAGYDRLIELTTPNGPVAHDYVLKAAMPDLVEAAVRTGQDATTYVSAFADWARHTTHPWAKPHLHRCRALLAGDDTADEQYRLALSAPCLADRPFDHARTALLHGQWLRRQRQPAAARIPLRVAVHLLGTIGATALADRARDELRAAGGSVDQAATTAAIARLTPQELQVARLAANGLSNREIGVQLYLSPRTVAYHLHKLFPKLGITSRSQLRQLNLT